MTYYTATTWMRRISGIALSCAMTLAAPTLSWAQTAPKLDKVVVAGWSKPITEITNLLVEEDKGFFKARGIELGYVPGAGGGDALRNLLSGQADVAFTDPGSFFTALDKGEKLRAIYDIYPQNVFNVVSLKSQNILKPADLKGKRVALDEPGSGTLVGTDFVAKSAPDGYTLLVSDASIATAPSLYKAMTFDPVKDLTAVSWFVTVPHVIVVNPNSQIQTLNDLIALAKKDPEKLYFSSGGIGSPLLRHIGQRHPALACSCWAGLSSASS